VRGRGFKPLFTGKKLFLSKETKAETIKAQMARAKAFYQLIVIFRRFILYFNQIFTIISYHFEQSDGF